MRKNDYKTLQIKTAKGFTFLSIREFFGKVIAIFGQIVLVRLLVPEYFGIFAILLFIIGIADLFTDIGLTYAIIQKKDEPTNEDLSSVFFVKQGLSLITILVIYFLSPMVTFIYANMTVEQIFMLYALSATLIIKSYKTILIALMERSLRFDAISKIEIFGIAEYYFAVLIFAFFGFGVWSFVIGVISKEILELLVSFYYKRWFPIFALNIKVIKNFAKFGLYLQFGVILGFIHKSTIPVVAGIKTTFLEVGLLDWSQNVSSIPRSFIENYGRVAFPSLSRIKSYKDRLTPFVEKSLSILGIITIFIILLALGFGPEFVKFILTDKWMPALPSLYWFVGSIFFVAGTSVLGQAIIALGKTKEILLISFFVIVTEWILAYVLMLKVGFVGIAIASFFGSMLLFFLYIFYLRKVDLKINYLKTYKSIIVIFLISFLFIKLINILIPNDFLFFTLKLFLMFIVYVVLVNIFAKNYLRQILIVIKNIFFSKR